MKISNIKYIALGIIAAALSFQACSDDEHYDVVGNPNNLVYFKTMGDAVTTCTVTHTPVGDFGEVNAKFSVAIQRAASRDTKVTRSSMTIILSTTPSIRQCPKVLSTLRNSLSLLPRTQ